VSSRQTKDGETTDGQTARQMTGKHDAFVAYWWQRRSYWTV